MNYNDALEVSRSRSHGARDEVVEARALPHMTYRDALDVSQGRSHGARDEVVEARVLGRRSFPQKKGTVLRVYIPAGAEINLLDIFEISSPGGICIIVRLPFIQNLFGGSNTALAGIFDSVKRAGGSIEVQ